MRESKGLFFAALAAAALWAVSCGAVINNPSPKIQSLSPSSVTAGQPGFTLTVNGGDFAPQSVIVWNGAARVSTFLGSTQLTAQITASDIALPGQTTVSVFTSAPGGGTSANLTFTINPAVSPVPSISSISPTTAMAGTAQLTLQITGTNFVPTSAVSVNGNNRIANFQSSVLLLAQLTQADLALPGNLAIAVVNPVPGGGMSNQENLSVINPAPRVSTISPGSATAGGSNLTLTVNGSGMDMDSVVNYNGASRSTTFVSNTQLTAILTQADLTQSGISQVEVVNPAPGGGTSNSVSFSINPSKTGAGLPTLVDVSTSGVQANNGIASGNLSLASLSGPVGGGSGRFVAFASVSDNLVAGDTNGVGDIFLRDTCFGTTSGCSTSTTRISVSTTNDQANAASQEPAMDSSGRFVAFTSRATNLDANFTFDGVTREVFLRDNCTGSSSSCTPSTKLVSVSGDGLSPAACINIPPGTICTSDAFQPAVSSDGRYVAFVSQANNLVTGLAPSAPQIFLRDTCLNQSTTTCTPSTILISTPDGTTPANAAASSPVAGSTAQFVAFASAATNLTAGATNGFSQIFVRKTCINQASSCTPAAILVSSPDASQPPTTPGNAASIEPAMTSDGRFFAFASAATNLVSTASSGLQQIFVRDTCTGVRTGASCAPSTSLVSEDGSNNPGNAPSEQPGLSSNGQVVSFASLATNLAANISNRFENVFVRNTCANAASGTNCTATTTVASVSATGALGNGNSNQPALGSDGRSISFLSFASNLVATDTNNAEDIFLAFATPVSVSVSPATATVSLNGTQQFTPTVINDLTNQGVTWTLSGPGCTGASCGSISPATTTSGVVTTYKAPSTKPTPATVIVTATSVFDTSKSASATVTLQ